MLQALPICQPCPLSLCALQSWTPGWRMRGGPLCRFFLVLDLLLLSKPVWCVVEKHHQYIVEFKGYKSWLKPCFLLYIVLYAKTVSEDILLAVNSISTASFFVVGIPSSCKQQCSTPQRANGVHQRAVQLQLRKYKRQRKVCWHAG